MTEIKDMDRRHFDQCIVAEGLRVDDFEITLKRDVPGIERTDSLGYAGTGTIKVIYKPTGIASYYRYGVVPPEHFQFERELKIDLFKTQ